MFRQYTKCHAHTPGDKPFNEKDLAGFVAGSAAPGLIAMIVSFLAGANLIGFIALAIQFAVTITAVAKQWLFHRLVCIPTSPDPLCAIGTVVTDPETGNLGEFDNDEYFNVRLMPHPPRRDGAADDEKRDFAKDVEADGFQGTALLAPVAWDLPYVDMAGTDKNGQPQGDQRAYLHCEAEGNFWQAMKDYAAILGVTVAVGGALGAAGGAALGCAIGGIFGPIGCLIGAIIGFIAGLLAGAGAAAAIGAAIAFASDPGNVEDTNVGDRGLGPIANGDRVVAVGQHVYDGFHDGWHEFHPLMMVMKIPDYLEQDPALLPGGKVPDGLTEDDVRLGLASPAFKARAADLRDRWCREVRRTLDPGLKPLQDDPVNRWTVHPDVDGCTKAEDPPPLIH